MVSAFPFEEWRVLEACSGYDADAEHIGRSCDAQGAKARWCGSHDNKKVWWSVGGSACHVQIKFLYIICPAQGGFGEPKGNGYLKEQARKLTWMTGTTPSRLPYSNHSCKGSNG
jgi:hypothetical protein